MAETSLKIAMPKMVWALDFEIEEQGGAGGRGRPDASVETGYEAGFLVCPKKSPIRIRPRSKAHAEVMWREFDKFAGFLEGLSA
jgi:hypothetical protein